jgi:SAM-dependent methyltransferase
VAMPPACRMRVSEGAHPGRSRADPKHRHAVLGEFDRSGLDLDRIGGNSGKLRLSLDLAAFVAGGRRVRILDVGCAGPTPLNLWEPFGPLAEQFDLVGVDVQGIDRAEDRARQLGFPIALHEASALSLTGEFGHEAFDAVVCTQVLEHLRDWRAGLDEMRNVLRPKGTLFVTCDSGDIDRALGNRLRLVGKRSYAVLRQRDGFVGRLADRFVSGEWEKGPKMSELRDAARQLDLDVQQLSPYAIRDVKRAQRHAGSRTRQLWLAFEEALASESDGYFDLGLYTVLYLRARRR